MKQAHYWPSFSESRYNITQSQQCSSDDSLAATSRPAAHSHSKTHPDISAVKWSTDFKAGSYSWVSSSLGGCWPTAKLCWWLDGLPPSLCVPSGRPWKPRWPRDLRPTLSDAPAADTSAGSGPGGSPQTPPQNHPPSDRRPRDLDHPAELENRTLCKC